MLNAAISIILALVFLLALLAGMVFLQIYLSKREGKWPGLILPIITLLISLLVIAGMAAVTGKLKRAKNGKQNSPTKRALI